MTRAMLGALLGLCASGGLLLIVLAAPRRRRRTGRLERLVQQSGLRTTPAAVIGACAAIGIVVAVLALIITAVPMIALLAAAAAGCLPVLLLRRRVAARQRALRACWPDAIDALVSAVRAGMALPEALTDLAVRGPAPLRDPFAAFAVEYRATGSFGAALDWLQLHLADPVADRVIASLRIAREVGGTDLGTVLRTLGAMIRQDARTRGDIEARQSWTVNAARMAVAAPWITLALLCTRPEGVAAYRSATGAVILVLAALLSFAAYRTMLAIGRLPSEARVIA